MESTTGSYVAICQVGHYTEIAPPVQIQKEGLSKSRKFFILISLTGISLFTNMSTGLVTIGLPRITETLQLAENLMLW